MPRSSLNPEFKEEKDREEIKAGKMKKESNEATTDQDFSYINAE